LINNLKTLVVYRDLLWMWIFREIKIRYKQSILGGAWAILQPFVLMIVFTIVFSTFARVPTDGIPYPIFSYSALLPWTLLATSVTFAVSSLVNNMNLLTKIYFPREILPIASIGAALVDFCVASIIFAGLMIYYQIPLHATLIWVPLLLLIQVALIIGISLSLSAINVFYRDIRFVVPLGLQIWLYASPVIYPLTLVPPEYRTLYMLNPMAGLIDSYRRVLLEGINPEPRYLGLAAIFAILMCLGAYKFFKRVEWQFADII
jgi:lipopolysaccharide transport system permease protein